MNLIKYIAGIILMSVPLLAHPQEESVPFGTVVPLQVVCLKGGPSEMAKILMDRYNEQVAHAMNLSTAHTDIQMFISENKNNPSSTLFLYNGRLNQTCIFWTAKDALRTKPIKNLPAKSPEDESKKESI